jgi:hypothetical protein
MKLGMIIMPTDTTTPSYFLIPYIYNVHMAAVRIIIPNITCEQTRITSLHLQVLLISSLYGLSRDRMSTAQGRAFGLSATRKFPLNKCLKVNCYEDMDIVKLLMEVLTVFSNVHRNFRGSSPFP